MALWTFPLVSIVALICFGCPRAVTAATDGCTYIDSTEDWCRTSDYIEIEGARIRKNTTGYTVKLTSLQTKLDWFCGETKEIVKWGQQANRLTVNYRTSGRIQWKIEKCQTAGRKCATVMESYFCGKFDNNQSEPCLFEVKKSGAGSHTETTTKEVDTSLMGGITGSNKYAEAKASAERRWKDSKSVTAVSEFDYGTKRILMIAPGYVFCTLKNGTSVADGDVQSGFRWRCSPPTFVQSKDKRQCTTLDECDVNVCRQRNPNPNPNPPIGVAASIRVGFSVLGLGLVTSVSILLL